MKTVLVTGATGFIGRHSLPALVDEGYEVHAVSSRPHAPGRRVRRHTCDLLSPKEVERLIARVKPTHLLHFAWYTVPGQYQESLENVRWLEAGLTLARLFAEAGGQRAVFAGSGFEYDRDLEDCREDTPTFAPSTYYASCKRSLREAIEAFSRQARISAAWGHIFHLFGPYEPGNRLVPSVILSLLRGERARCSHGRQIRDFLYVEDVASAFAAILNSDVEGRVNIGSGEPITIRTLVETIATQMGREDQLDFGALPPHPKDAPVLLPRLTRLHDEVGWRPRWSLEQGLTSTIQWWQSRPI